MGNSFVDKVTSIIKKYHLYAFKDVIIFMIILLVFHVLWKIFIKDIFTIEFIYNSAFWLSEKVFLTSVWILDLFNVNVTSFDELNIGGRIRAHVIYYAENNGFVSVNRSCSGLKQFYQWFFLMILFPGPWKHKLWFIPFGLVIIHFVNIFRILSMTYVTMTIPQHWDFMHDYVLRPFFYVVMFFLWVWWNEKFYLKKKLKKQKVPS
jgi:exosortase/archaeosortase family protein